MIGNATVLTETFKRFFDSEKAGGILLLFATLISVAIANSPSGAAYVKFWHSPVFGLSLELWINDALMAIFFLFIGLELERELYVGELSSFQNALLPLFAALGGMAAPALIHFSFNAGAPTQGGFGIPMATDIAFVLGVMALLGHRVPSALKVFAVAFAVVDDLGAIVVIALFYTNELSLLYLGAALAIWGGLIVLNRLRVMSLWVYLPAGAVMWFCMLYSGVHATLAGVMLAFAIPFTAKSEDQASPSHRLESWLHNPVAFGILPVFALANTCIVIGTGWASELLSPNSLGIAAGLLLGKPIGVTLACLIAVKIGWCRFPEEVKLKHVLGAGILGGIGFTMSIFITNLAFSASPEIINASKIAILISSLLAGGIGFIALYRR